MPKDYTALPLNHVRRSDRAVEDEGWIRQMLHNAAYGALATVHDGQPFINTNLFVYDEAGHALYTHTARVGRTRANIEQHDRVCFTVSEIGRLLPADEALEFSVEYSGVAVFGRGEVIEANDEARHGLQLLLDKYAPHLRPGEHYRPITDDELARTAVYKISIESWSGKRKVADPDFPGAYFYHERIELAGAEDAGK
jgi:nitroimidazol reductase NimA-like FMN-containing flavoprotein (pyridoxamine 5'-phosphate oxidase superfamily)